MIKYIELRHFYHTNSDSLYLIYLHRFSIARLAFGDQVYFGHGFSLQDHNGD